MQYLDVQRHWMSNIAITLSSTFDELVEKRREEVMQTMPTLHGNCIPTQGKNGKHEEVFGKLALLHYYEPKSNQRSPRSSQNRIVKIFLD